MQLGREVGWTRIPPYLAKAIRKALAAIGATEEFVEKKKEVVIRQYSRLSFCRAGCPLSFSALNSDEYFRFLAKTDANLKSS